MSRSYKIVRINSKPKLTISPTCTSSSLKKCYVFSFHHIYPTFNTIIFRCSYRITSIAWQCNSLIAAIKFHTIPIRLIWRKLANLSVYTRFKQHCICFINNVCRRNIFWIVNISWANCKSSSRRLIIKSTLTIWISVYFCWDFTA